MAQLWRFYEKNPVTPKEPVPVGKWILYKKLLLSVNYIEEGACVSRKLKLAYFSIRLKKK